jgi:hypothetical protein
LRLPACAERLIAFASEPVATAAAPGQRDTQQHAPAGSWSIDEFGRTGSRDSLAISRLAETGITTKMTRLRGRGLKGRRLHAKALFGHWLTQTFIAGLRCHGLTAPFVVDGPMNRRIFEAFVETQLAPTLVG